MTPAEAVVIMKAVTIRVWVVVKWTCPDCGRKNKWRWQGDEDPTNLAEVDCDKCDHRFDVERVQGPQPLTAPSAYARGGRPAAAPRCRLTAPTSAKEASDDPR